MQLEKTYEPAAVEAKWYPIWLKAGWFRPEAATDPAQRPFVMVIPPPNVTGSLHMGHALNNTLQDVLARYHRMNGRPTLWVPGTDHAGIATQVVVERQVGGAEARRQMGREKFVEKVWEWKKESGGTIIRQLCRLGVSCDWSRERFTFDDGLSRAVREVFVTLYKDGLIYRGDRLINWCVQCRTALSDLEVEYREEAGTLWHIRYGPLTVATVRPESKLGDTGLAVHPDDARYRDLVGKTLTVQTESGPLALPVFADAAVDPTFGTGVVKVTPAHDPTDYDMGQRHGLELKSVIGIDGTMTAAAGKYAGLDRLECRRQIVEDLRALGLLEKEEPYRHRVGVCYRCRTVVEPLVSRQWFVKIAPLAEPALAAVRDDRTRFVPKHWENTYFAWMENIRDWCISRQLWWGHRIPAWTCGCGELIVAREDPKTCPKCGGAALTQDEDVLDTWFSSALWPFSTLGWPEKTDDLARYYPTDVLVTGFDIIFFWVARMMMMGLRFMGEVPFRDVYIHGLVRDPLGKKMSKSKGNVVDPLSLLDTYGTDALRFALTAFAAMGRDIRVSSDRIEGYRNFTNKLWNAARFVLMNIEVEGAAFHDTVAELQAGKRPEGLTLADRWIVSRLERTVKHVRRALDEYRFNDAASRLYAFSWRDFCDWYLEAAKGPLLEGGAGADRTRGVLLHVLERLLRLLHPLMPFITEEIWQAVTSEGWRSDRADHFPPSIMVAAYPEHLASLLDPWAEEAMAMLQVQVQWTRNWRSLLEIPLSSNIRAALVEPDANERERLSESGLLLRKLARLGPIEVVDEEPKDTGVVRSGLVLGVAALGEAPLGVPRQLNLCLFLGGLAANVDPARRRVQSELEKATHEQDAAEKKLKNPDFVGKAPPEILEEVQEKYALAKSKVQQCLNNLAQLGSLEA